MTIAGAHHPVLNLTSEQFAAAHRGMIRDGDSGALRLYADFHRSGTWSSDMLLKASTPVFGTEPPALAPIGKVLVSESDEGRVVKFTQRVPRTLPGAAPSPISTTPAPAPTPTSPTSSGPLAILPSGPLPPTADTPTLETESVLIPMLGRASKGSKKSELTYTLCVSSQVGCAMGCTFCQTAQMGLVRSLTPGEIVQQWHAARHQIAPQHIEGSAPIRNIVFMGMGEPLDNLTSVIQAIRILSDHRGGGIASSRITVSTVGRVDKLPQFKDFILEPGFRRVGLAVSVNASNDTARSQIMPINRGIPMAALREAIADWPRAGTGYIMLEYVLIPGVNDSPTNARELAAWVRGDGLPATDQLPPTPLPACVNIIPYNPREGSPWPAPTEDSVEAFMAVLNDERIFVKRRRTKGRDQMAACGQLGNLDYRKKSRVAK